MTLIDLTVSPAVVTPAPAATSVSAAAPGLDAQLRMAGVIAVGALVVLNVVDVLLTKAFLRVGLQEGNPLMAGLVRDGRMAIIKGIILGALALKVASSPGRVGRTCFLWAAVGVYALASYVNFTALQSIGG